MDPANANNLPEATYQDIVTEFKVLLDGLSDVTTLDVKNSLRNKGFWVNQKDISDAIWDFVSNSAIGAFPYRYENGHRVYRSALCATQPVTAQSGSGNQVSLHHVNPKTFYKRVQVTGNWQVFARGGPMGMLPTEDYQNTTRNKARYEYAKQYNVAYVDTIAKKL